MTPTELTIGHRSGGICLLSSKTTLRDRVQDAGDQAGIGKFVPKQPAVSTTLRNSMLAVGQVLFGKKRKQPLVVRQLDNPRSFECVRVLPGTTRNEYVQLFSASIDDYWSVQLLDCYGQHLLPAYQVSAVDGTLQSMVYQMRDYLPAQVVSQVIVRGLQYWGAMPLKPDGGAWFLDGRHIDNYRTFASVVRGNGDGPLFQVTVFDIDGNPETAGHVLNKVRTTVQTGIDEIMQEVMEATGGMTDRSIQVRLNKANNFLALVEQYEELMGIDMPELRDAIERTKQAVAVNRLLAAAV